MLTKRLVGLAAAAAAAEMVLIHLGRTYGSTTAERRASLPGDDIIPDARVQTDHAVTIDAPPSAVWPWVVQMGWGRAATLDWTWTFVMKPLDGGERCRYHFRSRWVTSPWWLTIGGRFGIVPADFVMSRDHLRGIRERAERCWHPPDGSRAAVGGSPQPPQSTSSLPQLDHRP